MQVDNFGNLAAISAAALTVAGALLLAGSFSSVRADPYGQSAAKPRIGGDSSTTVRKPHSRLGGGNLSRDIGTGIAIGIGVGIMQQMLSQPSKAESTPPSSQPPQTKTKDSGKTKSVTKSKPPAQNPPPVTKAPSATKKKEATKGGPPPATAPDGAPPSVASCSRCTEYWERIRRYEEWLDSHKKGLKELEQGQEEAKRLVGEARVRLASATADQDVARAKRDLEETTFLVEQREKTIEDFKERIAKMEEFLNSQKTLFIECVEAACTSDDPEDVEPPQLSEALSAEPQISTPPPVASKPPLCPAAAKAPLIQERLVHDFNPNGPRPPRPSGRVFQLGERADWYAWYALFSFYNGFAGRMSGVQLVYTDANGIFRLMDPDMTPTGHPADALIIDGPVLESVQQQGDVVTLNAAVKNTVLAGNARNMLSRLQCGQSGNFSNRGFSLAMGDSTASRIHLAFGTFSVYWEAACEIGPKRCCIPDQTCASGWRNETSYSCRINWTMYDNYNFSHTSGTGGTGLLKRLNPLGWSGTSFHSFGYWPDTVAGTEHECVGP